MSASVGACIRVGRYEHPRRSMRASASVDADDKSREYEEEKRWVNEGKKSVKRKKERGKRGKEGCVEGVSKLPYS